MSTSFQPHTFTHPLLGPITGRLPSSNPAVMHFRSIPFATIPARFRQSVLLENIPSSSNGDFTEYGTACPAPDDHGGQSAASGGPLPSDEEKKYDEFSCLNLTISAPKEYLPSKIVEEELLPVMVYVHGGAFKVGDGNISALHDTRKLVDMSIKEGHPVIIVSIHYRLNWQGFLACQDLLEEAKTNNEASCNFGLQDQRTAFLWIKRFIPGFGGSPTRITAFGESAGSGSLALHMCCSIPLFNRAILMSGTVATGPPVDLKYKEAEYLALLKYCGIDANDEHRLRKLRDVSVETLVAAVDGVGIPLFNSLRDEAFFSRGFPTYFTQDELIRGCEWVDEIVIGDSFSEGFVLHDTLKHVPQDAFIALSDSTLGPSNAAQILAAYEITPTMEPNLFWARLELLMGDVMFSETIDKLARVLASPYSTSTSSTSSPPIPKGTPSPNKKVYRYTVSVRNPFPGSPHHHVPGHHFVEILFLFGTLAHRYPSRRLRDISDGFMRRWVRFGAGLEPWEEYRLGGGGGGDDGCGGDGGIGAGEAGEGEGEEEEEEEEEKVEKRSQEGREENGEDWGKIMVVSGHGDQSWQVKSRRQDEAESAQSEEGERRYKGWEAIGEVMGRLAAAAEEKGVVGGAENARLEWGTDGGVFRLAGLKGPYGVLIP